uniref:Uncharacterized protein n=1 Tax=Rhizophora mucronata TaxID=61149 RepID=A0A2P2MIW1_RHIMU
MKHLRYIFMPASDLSMLFLSISPELFQFDVSFKICLQQELLFVWVKDLCNMFVMPRLSFLWQPLGCLPSKFFLFLCLVNSTCYQYSLVICNFML